MKKIIKMDLRVSLLNFDLNFNFVKIHIIHKIFVFIKNHINFLKDNIFLSFSRSIIDFYLFKKIFFFHNI